MRKYNPNPKHETSGAHGRKGTRLNLSEAEAKLLLNDPVYCLEIPGQRQLIGVKNGRIYAFQNDGTDGYHAYPITGQEVYQKYPEVAPRIAAFLGVNIKRLSRMDG